MMLKPGQEVDVRWTWERVHYEARAIVEEVNPKSIRVSLRHEVITRGSSSYPQGTILRLPAKDVTPPAAWTEQDRDLQIRAFTTGLSDEEIRFIVEAIAEAWNNDPYAPEKTSENNFESVFSWIMLVNAGDTRGLTPDEQLWGYYETYVISFRDHQPAFVSHTPHSDIIAASA
jgi:hypothetical protein